ncbi:hypothetical protein [Acetobacterium bakii]|uniref:Uncharacterized protein n=1 Tax=Acetobacterium bakii TaxID=52689 RepID=A0A0L6TZP8_9FIRM|nr:hypothetical protein [Acetobacterium bakii]KNZ41718.1 hypothetical protein AKG39_10330 [Acetobacterium bakii]
MSIIKNTIESYKYIYPVEKEYPLEVIVNNTIYSERLKLCHSKDEQAAVEASRSELEALHQLLVLPDDQDSHFYLLLHEDLFNDTNAYAQTIPYEYTRVIDFAACQEKYAIKNMRADSFPDSDCFEFLSQVRACFRGFSLYYNLTSIENKAAIFSYLCGMVPNYEEALSHDVTANMESLAAFYGQRLAISAYVNFELSLPDYLNHHPVHDLLILLDANINNADIFENYDRISEAYSNFVLKKTKILLANNPKCGHNHK